MGMKGKKATAALGAAVATLGVAAWASANPADGPYIRVEGGATLPSNITVTSPSASSFTLSPSAGPIAGGAVGLRLAPFRLEIDVDWMHSSLSSNAPALSGTIQNIPVMMNGYVDWVNSTPFEPYLGFGLGFTAVTLKANTATGAQAINSSERVFAFQPIVGVNFAVTDQVTLGLQYRYFQSVNPGLTTNASQRISITNASHNVLATLTYHFIAPAAAPATAVTPQAPTEAQPPAPVAPAVARPEPQVFLVFFDFNSAKLTAAGRRSADEAVLAYKQDPTNDIEVRGYTDLVGSDAYNLDLSKRRAMTVYDYFAAHGVKPADMGIDWQGKANPRVQTDKPEAQNRRVEISM